MSEQAATLFRSGWERASKAALCGTRPGYAAKANYRLAVARMNEAAARVMCCPKLGKCNDDCEQFAHCLPHDRTESCVLHGCVSYPTKEMVDCAEMRMISRAQIDPPLTQWTKETKAQRGQRGRG